MPITLDKITAIIFWQNDKIPHKIQYFISAYPPFFTKDMLIPTPTVVKKKHIR